ncbi:MAG TPA: TetR family transcriptional regulator, partial [Homoserinimonas sp.]|nr:TetR family transcriptional regulator [Homoserinimonas sp.]
MPKLVDHDQRRREIVEAIWAVIVRQGLVNATMREIAKEAGYSSGILVHYFTDKADLLVQAMQAAHREVHHLLEQSPSYGDLTGLAALREYMLACLPLDARRRMLAAVEIAFWGEAIGNPALLSVNDSETEAFNARVRARLEEAERAGELNPSVSIGAAVRSLRVLMD